jgi:hypothetical protein
LSEVVAPTAAAVVAAARAQRRPAAGRDAVTSGSASHTPPAFDIQASCVAEIVLLQVSEVCKHTTLCIAHTDHDQHH